MFAKGSNRPRAARRLRQSNVRFEGDGTVEQQRGTLSAWEAAVLPLNYARDSADSTIVTALLPEPVTEVVRLSVSINALPSVLSRPQCDGGAAHAG